MTPPPRLLMTVDAVGGVWQYATELCAALAPMGVETVLACLGPAPDGPRLAEAAAIPGVSVVDTRLDLDWLAPDAATVDAMGQALADLARAHAVSVVHCNHPALATREIAVPVVASIHSCVATWWDALHGGSPPDRFGWHIERVGRGLRRADSVVAPSHAFAEAVARLYDLPRWPQVVANGRSKRPVCASAVAGDSVFTAGRLWDKGKDVARLDRVASRLSRPFRAAGPVRGPNGESITLDHIEELGALDDRAIADRLAGRPVFASAARYEPFGLAVLEAAQAGCPLILSDIATFREIWDGAAHFVRVGDDTGYVEAIEALLADGDARAIWGARAQERAALYTPGRTARGMMAIYAQVLAGARAKARSAVAA